MSKTTQKATKYTLIAVVLYVVLSVVWSLLNAQTCTINTGKDATCEEIAEDRANNCEYSIMKWKKVSYEKELNDCLDWERNN